MKSLLYITAVALTALTLSTGCSSTGCTENQNSVPLAGFYSISTGDAVSIDSLAIGGVGAPNDSLLVGPSERASQVYLPLRSTETSTTFVIKYMQKALAQYGLEDRITFYYEASPWFASEECGAMYHYHITRVSHTSQLLDSVGISDSLVTNIERETIGLYFRTSDPDEPETPTEPEEPTDPEGPTDPETPSEPEEPVDPEEPTEPTEPEVPAEPETPAELSESAGPAELSGSVTLFCSGSVASAAAFPSPEVAPHE